MAKEFDANADYNNLETYLKNRTIPYEEMSPSENKAWLDYMVKHPLTKRELVGSGYSAANLGELLRFTEERNAEIMERQDSAREAAVIQRFRDARAKKFDHGGVVDQGPIGQESSLSNWAGPYVTDMLGKGKALASTPYQAYSGPLTAGQSGLQNQAYQGLSSLSMPTSTMGAYSPTSFNDPGVAQQYMNPYLSASLEPQLAEAQRQADIQRVQGAGRMTKAGAYGGSRQAIMESEGIRNLLRNMADITGQGYNQAFMQGQGQFNTEEQRRQQAQQSTNQYGFDVANAQQGAGGVQRGIEGEGIAADYGQFKEERDDPFKKLQYQQSLLQGMPVEAQANTYTQPTGLSSLLGGAGGMVDFVSKMMNLGCPEGKSKDANGNCV